MTSRYDLYCPVAHALKLVGDRWALMVVLELMRGPKRYTDLVDGLPGIGTNILATRLRDLEMHGILTRRKLPPPAASRVYELTEYGRGLKPVIRELALWGARSLGPPHEDDHEDLFPGWLSNAIDTVLAPVAPPGRFELRVGSEVAGLVDGEAVNGPIEHPDVVIEGDPDAVYYLFTEGRLDAVTVSGDRELLQRLVDRAPRPIAQLVAAPA
ncbi:MAG TPA: helix-turn-helix domain-containing protein [Actinomycetes bacterium]|nr:helix-turn-helix domain-containing protein [Actinomycetes bacterium]